ncbi:MAG: nucleotidyltransferase [Lentisphaerae bacterium RIFOXYB12_FULL_65_16]|nr:MAG: nucleotidyltransferase [Lentisphaerae bacterium RIFOXYA12_64_32]OGV90009.1 MAG: nucleotidyltransferase [Lentisphaerae bacterium RIFOXYB12_FULL_65_16]
MSIRITVPREAIAEFCRRNRIRRLAFFGSVISENFGPDSDVDVLVEFEPGCCPGLAFFSMQDELSALLGRTVDLNTPGFLSPYFRDQALASAEVAYAA